MRFFPWWTLAAGIACAVVVSLARRWATARVPDGPSPSEPAPPWRAREVAELLCVVGLALLLRLWGLEQRPLDNDELVGPGLSGLEAWARERDAELHPPLPALLMTLFSGGRADPIAARGVSVLAGVAAVAATFALGRRAGGRLGAWVAALAVAAAPGALHVAQLARGYALLALAVLLAHLCLTRALESMRERWWLAYTASVAMAVLSEYIALAPVLVDAGLAMLLARGARRRLAVGAACSAGLIAVSFLMQFAAPPLWLGGGGRPREPTGIVRALEEIGGIASGALPPWVALLVAGAVAAAWIRRPSPLALRVAAQLGAIVLAVVIGAALTSVRGRYWLHGWPLAAVLLGGAAARLPRIGLVPALVTLTAQLALLPAYYRGDVSRYDDTTGPSLGPILAPVRREPGVAVAVAPFYGLGEPLWRLERVVPGPTAGGDCPAVLCVPTPRRSFYGVRTEPGSVEPLLRRHSSLFVIVRYGRDRAQQLPASCSLVLRDGATSLYRCTQSAS